MGESYAWLFGRRSYEDLLVSWNAQGGPFKDALNDTHTQVRRLQRPKAALDWPDSTLLCGGVPTAVAELKRRSDANLVIMGSGVLIESLMWADMIDQYLLMVAPIVLGLGAGCSPEGSRATLRLRDCLPASTGAVVATYEPVR